MKNSFVQIIETLTITILSNLGAIVKQNEIIFNVDDNVWYTFMNYGERDFLLARKIFFDVNNILTIASDIENPNTYESVDLRRLEFKELCTIYDYVMEHKLLQTT